MPNLPNASSICCSLDVRSREIGHHLLGQIQSISNVHAQAKTFQKTHKGFSTEFLLSPAYQRQFRHQHWRQFIPSLSYFWNIKAKFNHSTLWSLSNFSIRSKQICTSSLFICSNTLSLNSFIIKNLSILR